tara:strand:+ start:367 stop:555 length:189 start_codon:yes stop_codon:yes gene_type:complete
MNIENLGLSYGSAFDPHIAKENAKKKCRLCYGRGSVMITYPKHNAASKSYCDCVYKKLEKEE